MKGLAKAFDGFWFRPADPRNLAVCRMLFFGWLFLWYLGADFSFITGFPAAFWTPQPLLAVLGLDRVPPESVVLTTRLIFLSGLLLTCVGLMTRSSILVAAVSGTYLLALTHSFHKTNHSDAALVLAMFVLAFSHCGRAWSLDAWLRSKRARDANDRAGLTMHGEYRWPVQMVRLLVAITFFLAGAAKLRFGGMDWMFRDGLSNLLLRQHFAWQPPLDAGVWLASQLWICRLLSVGTVVLELAAPLALISRGARALIIPGLLGMQVGILMLMGDNFTQFMALYVFFVPWLWILQRLGVIRGHDAADTGGGRVRAIGSAAAA